MTRFTRQIIAGTLLSAALLMSSTAFAGELEDRAEKVLAEACCGHSFDLTNRGATKMGMAVVLLSSGQCRALMGFYVGTQPRTGQDFGHSAQISIQSGNIEHKGGRR